MGASDGILLIDASDSTEFRRFDIREEEPPSSTADDVRASAETFARDSSAGYLTDHKMGRSADSRMQSAWFGQNQARKVKAVNKAVEYATAA